jgi:hypothetical protein
LVDVADYGWVQDQDRSLNPAACITLVPGGDVAAVLRAFGAEPLPTPLDEAEEDNVVFAVGVVETPDGIIAIEINGYQGCRSEVLRCVAAHGRAASAFWNVNAVTRVSLAQDGRILSAFEAMPGSQRVGDAPEVADEYVGDLQFAIGEWTPSTLVVAERFTGLRLTPEMVDRMDSVHIIRPVARDQS